MLKFNFLPKFSIVIFFGFFLFTIIGTLTHEFGHIAVAKYFGYETILDYGSMNYFPLGFIEDKDVKEIETISKEYLDIEYEQWPEDLKLKIKALDKIIMERYPYKESYKSNEFWITIGGPVQTILTSFLGLLILYVRRKIWMHGFKTVDWLFVFMSLFAIREVFNFINALYSSIMYSESNFHGDEFRISRYLEYNEWVVPTLTMILGLLISCYVIFKVIPLKYRFTFIISGIIGGITGYAIWFGFLGELLL
ncbi:hypothetical protein [Winogradskyella forsetii]|uniref:hypothetical protein n=1 Tax=Winogradskyella forsetii TaxID=2686077 RepID=UPI0015C025B0|nr:hypothetical protein [Winogradskyella forsetii]